MSKLHLFLTELDNKGISYVSWKNNHQLASVFSGKTDLDLFVPSEERSMFIEICRSQDWIELVNPVSIHPWVSHFYLLGEKSEIFHIHAYFKIITGDTWVKEYAFPFDDWLIENRIWNAHHEIWVLNNSSQAYLFLIRHLLKCGTFSGRILYKKELLSYQNEWKACIDRLDKSDIQGPIDLSNYLDGTRAFGEKLELPEIRSAVIFRLRCFPFMLYNIFCLPLYRIRSFGLRFYNKFILKRKKLLPQVGITIAISGTDGSGKTTMLEEIDRIFGNFITVKRFHLGRPQGNTIEFLWRLLGNRSDNSALAGTLDLATPTSLGRAINSAVLALLRLFKARSIIKRARWGGLMLVDRWPTNQIGKMDGPRIILGDNPDKLLRVCKIIESWCYSNMPQADLCYFFTVPVEVATERNRNRIKQNKETDHMISARYYGNIDYKPLAKKTVRFDNSGEFSLRREELLHDIWHQISSRY